MVKKKGCAERKLELGRNKYMLEKLESALEGFGVSVVVC